MLRAHPTRSNREIARSTGTSHPMVARVRAELADSPPRVPPREPPAAQRTPGWRHRQTHPRPRTITGRASPATADEYAARVAELTAEIERAKEWAEKYRQRAAVRGAAIRDYRRGDLWYQRALRLGFAVYDLLPEEVMIPLMQGDDVSIRIEGAEPPHDATVLVLPASAREALDALREVWTLREDVEMDDAANPEAAFRDAWTRELDYRE